MKRAPLLAGAAGALFMSVAVAAEDRFLGTWIFDPHESSYGGDELPREAVMSWQPDADGVHYRSRTAFASGYTLVAEYTADLAGHLALVQTSQGFLTPVSLKRIDSSTLQADYQRGFRTIASSRSVVSEDGQTLTMTTHSTATNGVSSVHVGVYHKQSSVAVTSDAS